ncbi:MarR family winged helix-turn-helix transcriptional regulator [Amycolatopsis solani]|uniref:MarR family winged helix-turn-helix transcriptional regulator n=1 Tax=Amycolatopsis solani TaxID=3028615 RepID=UPI0025B20C33|nr:MarR family transcriptional regulator [Amycolatopsis sp. MEP2-6]
MDRLSKDEMALWHAWKRAAETVRARVAEDIAAETGLSDPDFGVLTRVTEDGRGRLRQNQLADSMGWHRSRLSHHLTRMEQRGLVTRRPVDGGVEVVVTDAGRAEAARARPVHARAVRAHLVEPLGKADRATFFACLEALTESRD